jgi:adenosylhomocysteine nucleosidase
MNQFEIPLLGKTYFECHELDLNIATRAVNDLLESKHLHNVIDTEALEAFKITAPQLFIGDIASGDKFFSNSADKNKLLQKLPAILCVEMEGAAVAQVCYEYNIQFTILRTISDVADEQSPIDFPAFIKKISSKYAVQIIKNIYRQL